jgi:hypothetical protein
MIKTREQKMDEGLDAAGNVRCATQERAYEQGSFPPFEARCSYCIFIAINPRKQH